MSTKPDILLTIDPDEHNPKPRHIIVEVKTCNDTRYEDQLQRARAQHAALSEALKKTNGDHRVEVTGWEGAYTRNTPLNNCCTWG